MTDFRQFHDALDPDVPPSFEETALLDVQKEYQMLIQPDKILVRQHLNYFVSKRRLSANHFEWQRVVFWNFMFGDARYAGVSLPLPVLKFSL